MAKHRFYILSAWRRFGLPRVVVAMLATAACAAAAHARTAVTPAADEPASAPAAQPAPAVSGAAPTIGDVSVVAPSPPSSDQLAGDSLHQFVAHHATVHYINTGSTRNLARWRGGRQSICPATLGLSPGQNAFVTARFRAVAEYVGAPVDSDPKCTNTVQLIFTNNPEKKMDEVQKWATVYFRNRYKGGSKDLIAFKSDHPIQGWYMATTSGDSVLNTDVSLVGIDVQPVWPLVTQKYNGTESVGTRLGGTSGSGIGIGTVILVVDTTKVGAHTVGTIADYLAMMSLSIAQTPDHCDPLPSIFDLMSPSCGAREAPIAITAGDLAFLKALYYRNTGLGPSVSRDEIEGNMIGQFGAH